MDLHSEAAKRLQPCAELRALASAVGGRLFRLNGEQLIGGSLELVWLDTERPALPREEVDVGALWDILHDDACFESGWASERLPCHLPEQCRVNANLNGLAQALENILRNAIRHSPREGSVRLAGRLKGSTGTSGSKMKDLEWRQISWR